MGFQGVPLGIHYLDDFLLVGKPGVGDRAHSLQTALATCQTLGVPVAPHKVEGPSTVLTFLGICLDTSNMEVRLPNDKLLRLQTCRRTCIKRELLSLLGMLHHAAKVVPPGRTFLRRMIDTSMLATQNHHHRSRFSVRPTLVEFVPQQLERYSDDPSGTHTLGHSGHI